MMRVSELLSGSPWNARHEIGKSLCFLMLNCVVPMLLNIGYEARQRSQFSTKDEIEGIKPAWAWILSVQQRINSWKPLVA